MSTNIIWEEVFKYLDVKSLKEAALVCQNWNEIIGNTPVIMNRFTLQLRWEGWMPKVDEILSLNRKFQRMDVYFSNDNKNSSVCQQEVEAFKKISEKHGTYIKKLKFNKQSFHIEALQAFKNFPALRFLKIEQFQLRHPSGADLALDFPVVELKHLTDMELTLWSTWLIFKSFRCPNLRKFAIKCDFETEPREPFVNFLVETKNLESLELGENSFAKLFFSDDVLSFQFKLKTLTLSSKRKCTGAVNENFVKFLDSQEFSLKNVSFEASSQEIAEGIFKKLKRLRQLQVNVESLSKDAQFYQNLKPIESLRILITEKIPDEGLLGVSPNLEALKISYQLGKVVKFLSEHNPNLKAIETKAFDLTPQQAKEVKLKSLKYLNIEYSNEDSKALMKFLENHQTIETFCLRYAHDDKIFKALSKMPNLKHLKFGGETDSMQTFFKKSHKECKYLKTLEIIFEKIPGRPDVLFKFPEDAGQLLVKCPYVAKYEKTPESEFGYRLSVCHTSDFVHGPLMRDYCSEE